MQIITEGHSYLLANMDHPDRFQELHFIHMLPDGTRDDATTNEEVIDVLIDRMNYLDNKFPCDANKIVINCLISARKALDLRTKDRVSRNVEGTHQV